MWSTGGRTGKAHQNFCCESPIKRMKRQKDMTPEDEAPMSEGVQYGTKKEWRAILIAPERMKRLGQSRKDI